MNNYENNQQALEEEFVQMMNERQTDWPSAVRTVIGSYDADFLREMVGDDYFERMQRLFAE
jgi:hypothetical protein